MAQAANRPPLRIAVVAVHGVGDQEPQEMLHGVANCLLTLNRVPAAAGHASAVQYTPFQEIPVRVATRRAEPQSHNPQPATQAGRFDESSNYARALHEQAMAVRKKDALAAAAAGGPTYDHGFMVELLRSYEEEGPAATYETVRMEGARLKESGAPGAHVHLFEMYWADLSRLGTGFLRVFGDFYQLLFHIPDIGYQTADFARAAQPGSRPWRALTLLHALAGRSLTLVIPILNLYLLAVTALVLPGNLPPAVQPLVVFGVLDVGCAALLGWLLLRVVPLPGPAVWAAPLLLALAGAAVEAWVVLHHESLVHQADWGYQHWLALEWLLVAGLLLGRLLRTYARSRPGARLAGQLLGVPTALVVLWFVLHAGNCPADIARAAFRTAEVLFLALWLTWSILGLLIWCVLGLGLVAACCPSGDADAGERARRAFITAWLSLVLPAALALVLTLTAWAGLYRVTSALVPERVSYRPLLPWLDAVPPGSGGCDTLKTFGERLFVISGTPAFGPAFLLMALAGVLVVWGVFPAVWLEVVPPGVHDRTADDRFSVRLGRWLSWGFGLFAWAGWLFFVAFSVVLPAGDVARFLYLHGKLSEGWLKQVVQWGLEHNLPLVLGGVLAGGATGLLAFRGRLDKLALGFRAAVDVAIDVDNHLRVHPRKRTSRARICARYVSLLRYLCNWTDPRDGGRYHALVIVAHSQGTVITADLLRFLHTEGVPGLDANGLSRLAVAGPVTADRMPVYYFTMGCPLRQLYSPRVPHLYEWVRNHETGAQSPADLADRRNPDPCDLGVRLWMNAYRSGDYVGRYLWRLDHCPYLWKRARVADGSGNAWERELARPPEASFVSRDHAGLRYEFCIGPGAHTHYFDQTAPVIAAALDYLILRAATEASKAGPAPPGPGGPGG